nr:hypothetical protein [Streptomonospora sp. PA3]
MALSAVLPASADPVPPLATGASGEPEAAARIAFVDWCGRGAIGAAGAAGNAQTSSGADWSADPRHVSTGRHFPEEPADAYSSVVHESGRLTAAAGIAGVRFSPDCRTAPGVSLPVPVAEAFGRDHLLALDSAASTAWWSAASGPSAQITVKGLTVLGRPADVSDGAYTGTFTAASADGTVSVTVRAERGVARPAQSADAPYRTAKPLRAAAWLSVRFEVVRLDADGEQIGAFDYAVEFAGAAVHVPAGGVPANDAPSGGATAAPDPRATHESPGPGATADPGPGTVGDPGAAAGSAGGSVGAPPSDGPAGGGSPAATAPPGDPAGDSTAETARPPGDGGGASADAGEAPTQQEPAPGPTVAAPTDPEHAPSVEPGEDADPASGEPAGGRLPVAGSALIGLVATGLAALGGGGTAIYLGRGRKSGFDGDDVGPHRSRGSAHRDWS